jgi:hypothetical protein
MILCSHMLNPRSLYSVNSFLPATPIKPVTHLQADFFQINFTVILVKAVSNHISMRMSMKVEISSLPIFFFHSRPIKSGKPNCSNGLLSCRSNLSFLATFVNSYHFSYFLATKKYKSVLHFFRNCHRPNANNLGSATN